MADVKHFQKISMNQKVFSNMFVIVASVEHQNGKDYRQLRNNQEVYREKLQ